MNLNLLNYFVGILGTVLYIAVLVRVITSKFAPHLSMFRVYLAYWSLASISMAFATLWPTAYPQIYSVLAAQIGSVGQGIMALALINITLAKVKDNLFPIAFFVITAALLFVVFLDGTPNTVSSLLRLGWRWDAVAGLLLAFTLMRSQVWRWEYSYSVIAYYLLAQITLHIGAVYLQSIWNDTHFGIVALAHQLSCVGPLWWMTRKVFRMTRPAESKSYGVGA